MDRSAFVAFIVLSLVNGIGATCGYGYRPIGPTICGSCPNNCYSACYSCCQNNPAAAAPMSMIMTTCADRGSECAYRSEYCNLPEYKELMTWQCARTCGRCSSSPAASTCMDKSYDCPYQMSYCTSAQYQNYMFNNCAKTCGFCQAAVSQPQPTASPVPAINVVTPATGTNQSNPLCYDKGNNCAANKNMCNNADYVTLMTEQCAMTCGKC